MFGKNKKIEVVAIPYACNANKSLPECNSIKIIQECQEKLKSIDETDINSLLKYFNFISMDTLSFSNDDYFILRYFERLIYSKKLLNGYTNYKSLFSDFGIALDNFIDKKSIIDELRNKIAEEKKKLGIE